MTDAEERGPRAALVVAAALLVVAVTYVGVLDGGFVWDDRLVVERAPLVRELAPLGHYFTRPFWLDPEATGAAGAYYRPLVTLSLALDHAVHGANPAGFHLTNLLVHAVNVVLVYLLARRFGTTVLGAGAAATAFGVAPRLSESAAWVSGRTDALAALFCLAALLLFQRRFGAWLAALGVGLGLCSKEVAVAVLPALAVFAWRDEERDRRDAWLRLVPTLGVTVAYFAMRARVLPKAISGLDMDAGLHARVVLEAAGRYAMMLFDAWRPATLIGFVGAPSLPFVVLGAVVVPLAGFSAWRARGQLSTPVASALALSAAALLPVLHIVPLPTVVVAADRFLYLPVAGIAVAAAPALGRWLARSTRARVTTAVVVASLAVVCARRAPLWGDEVRLWADAVEHRHPNDPLPLAELGNLELRVSLFSEALASYRAAGAVDLARGQFDMASVRSGEGTCLSLLGRHGEAIATLTEVVRRHPSVPKHRLDLGLARLHALDFAGARADIRAALELRADYPQARDALGLLDELERDFPHLPPAARQDAPALRERARFHSRAGRPLDATTAWLALLRRPDATVADADEASAFLVRHGSLQSALEAFELWRGLGGEPKAELLDALAYRVDVARRVGAT